jgi:murein L,D-transpeptidase YcbB/YkuD
VTAPAEAPAALPTGPQSAKPKAPKKKKRVAAPAGPRGETVVVASDTRPTFSPGTFDATAKAYETYRGIVEAGGWPKVPAGAKYARGASGPAIAALRARLAATGDLPAHLGGGDTYDEAVTAAVRVFQARHGLRQNGLVAGRTLAALNVSAEMRFRQLAAAARRLALSQFGFGERYVVVNIPAATVETVEHGKVVRRFTAVVGKADRASPEVETRITAINFNPTWTVPTSIIKKDIIPKMQRDRSYLARAKIRVLDGRGQEINPATINWNSEKAVNFTLRQDPGAGNALGSVRIDMPNKHAVYMHDTPSKRLFASDDRFHSSGCVRVEGVRDLVTWLVAPQGWTRDRVDAEIAEGDRTTIRLTRPVPVAWVYLTAYATPDGVVHFRNDVYTSDRGPGGSPVAEKTQ